VSRVKALIKAGLARFGYMVVSVPPRAAAPGYAIEFDFEYVLAHFLAGRSASTPPYFLQIGAYDGVSHDPFTAHIRLGGWHGILVEPQPAAFARLIANYADVSGLAFVNAAVASEPGSRPLYVIQDNSGSHVESLGRIASFDRTHLERIMSKASRRFSGTGIGSMQVPCTTFEEILSETTSVDLLLIDTEGYDLELLKLFDFDRFQPAIVRFEHDHLSRPDWDEAVELLYRSGYRTLREEYDTTGYRAPPTVE
jgi:FkbM family methyltransferase